MDEDSEAHDDWRNRKHSAVDGVILHVDDVAHLFLSMVVLLCIRDGPLEQSSQLVLEEDLGLLLLLHQQLQVLADVADDQHIT